MPGKKRPQPLPDVDLFEFVQREAVARGLPPANPGLDPGPGPAAHQVTKRVPVTRHVIPDPDHIADLEMSDGQRMKRMADRAAGKPVKRPHPR